MSGVIGVGVNALTYIGGVLFRTPRSIGTFVPDVTIREEAVDEITITEHPVEKSANISDHAFKMPAEVRIEALWSNASVAALGYSESYGREIYSSLLKLQESRVPFVLVTGKRRYENMLLQSLVQITDRENEYCLNCHIVCRQVIIVQVTDSKQADADAQKDAKSTAATQDTGVKQATEPTPEKVEVIRERNLRIQGG